MGNIGEKTHVKSPVFEIPPHDIKDIQAAHVADMAFVVGRDPAGIDIDFFPLGVDGNKLFFFLGQRIVNMDGHGELIA